MANKERKSGVLTPLSPHSFNTVVEINVPGDMNETITSIYSEV